MSEDRVRILNMLAEGKITAEEADKLLDALSARTSVSGAEGGAAGVGAAESASRITGDPTPVLEALPKTLYVKVESPEGENVDIKVPLSLVRAGLKLTSLIPSSAMDEINESLAKSDISIYFNNLKAEDID